MNAWSSHEGNRKVVNGVVIVTTGGNVGNSGNWERNEKKCAREGITEFCQHCHAPLVGTQTYEVNIWGSTNFAPIGYTDENTKTVLLGSSCVRQFLDKDFIKTYAVKVVA